MDAPFLNPCGGFGLHFDDQTEGLCLDRPEGDFVVFILLNRIGALRSDGFPFIAVSIKELPFDG